MSSPFAFYRVRSGSSDTQFNPGSGTRLRFANKDADSLELHGIAQGFLQGGDKVRVTYKSTTVFVGDVDSRVQYFSKGDTASENVVCLGPWGKMSKITYRQNWKVSNGFKKSSRIVLNQYQDGTSQSLTSELREIANAGATACGYSYTASNVSISTQKLPFDECRDITIAEAIRRELRFFPRSVVRFDYSQTTPAIHIARIATGGNDASYIASIPKTQRQKRYTETPITGVYLEIETVGDGWRDITHQSSGNTQPDNPGCLYATIQLAGATSSLVTQSFKSVTEAIPANLSDQSWWMAMHPRLKGLASNQVVISDGARSDSGETTQYPRIAKATAGELQAAGLHCRVVEFTCKATITTADDVETDVLLSMSYLTTDATTKTYSWVVSSSYTEGETAPSGLAAAILADRSGSLKSEKIVMRLGDSLPVLGDLCDGLPLQSYEIDCQTLIADLDFGVPEYLSPEDMASLLSGFRNKRRATISTSRITGKVADESAKTESGAIMPITATDWSPGKKSKTTIGGTNTGSINLDSSGLASGTDIAVKEIGMAGAQQKAKILASANVEIAQKTLAAGANITLTVSQDGKTITIAATGAGGATSGYSTASGAYRYTVRDVQYDTDSCQLQVKYNRETWSNGVMVTSEELAWQTMVGGQAVPQSV